MSSTASPLNALLHLAVAQHASDLHLSAGLPPMARVLGALIPLGSGAALADATTSLQPHTSPSPQTSTAPLTHEALLALLTPLMDAPAQARFAQGHEVDFAFAVAGLGRFRANAFMQQHGCGAVLRHIPQHTPTLDALQTPRVLPELLKQVGLLLVTGPTGSGKSTTLAAMVQHLNTTTQQHIVTLEDPIEFVHTSAQCVITQREIGTHSHSFAHALRAALREDPDVILVGELRDLDTIRLALTAAETGHLVLASLHTRSAAASVDRIVDVFDAHEKALVRTQLSEALIGVITQTLCPAAPQHPGAAPSARCAVFETLVATTAIRNLIREGKTAQMQSAQQTGAAHGMQTMAQALQEARANGRMAAN